MACRCHPQAMGDLIVYDDDVKAKKRQVDLAMKNLQLAADSGACRLSAEEASSLDTLFHKWVAFYNRSIPIWGASEQMREANEFESRVREWRDQLRNRCALVGPDVVAPPEPAPSLPEQWISMLKIGLPSIALVAVAVVVGPLVWEAVTERHTSKAAARKR